MPAISVIVPVYNVEHYLRCCIDSILAQTFTDFELILVDDGSPDGSGAICDEYAARDSRVRVIHKENGGVSSARNAGIDILDGEFLTFVDADDALMPDALEAMFESARAADLVIGGFNVVKYIVERNEVITTSPLERKMLTITSPFSANDIQTIWKCNNMQSSCGKMYRAKIIKENSLRFDQSMIVLEDYDFVLSYTEKANYIISIPNVVYKICKSDMPLIHRRARRDYVDDVEKAYNHQCKLAEDVGLDDDILWDLFNGNVGHALDCIFALEYSNISEKVTKYQRIRHVLKKPIVQRYLQDERNSHSKLEHFLYRHGYIYSIMLLEKIRTII